MALNLGLTALEAVMLGTTAVERVMVGTTEIWVAETVVVLSNATQVNIQSLFSTADWTSTKRKRVVIPPGVTIGSTAVGTAALRTGTGWGGQLVIDGAGSIQGAGGAANGGVGGNAFQADQPGVIFNNSGTIYAGGGGGGRGGNGGNGSYNYNYREPASGWRPIVTQVNNAIEWVQTGNDEEGRFYYHRWYWGPTQVAWNTATYSQNADPPASIVAGGWTYLRGPRFSNGWWYIARQQTRSQATTGGAGGNGGRGQGYGQTRANGSAGAAGGTNAGAGGTGGGGGTWGVSGSTGGNGINGNISNGAAGAAGGLAGFAIVNPSYVSLTNSGTVLGR